MVEFFGAVGFVFGILFLVVSFMAIFGPAVGESVCKEKWQTYSCERIYVPSYEKDLIDKYVAQD